MPAPVLKALADKSGKSLNDLERYWDEAKKSAEEKGLEKDSPKYWAYVTAIVKNRAGVKESYEQFLDSMFDILLEQGAPPAKPDAGGEAPISGAKPKGEVPAAKPKLPPAAGGKMGGASAGGASGAAANLPPLGNQPIPPGTPGAPKPEDLPPQNIKGETLVQQYARKKGKTETEIENMWLKAKNKAKEGQGKSTDQEMLETALKIFHEMMDKMKNVEPPEPPAPPMPGQEGGAEAPPPPPGTEPKEKKPPKGAEEQEPDEEKKGLFGKSKKKEEKPEEKSKEEKAKESMEKTEQALLEASILSKLKSIFKKEDKKPRVGNLLSSDEKALFAKYNIPETDVRKLSGDQIDNLVKLIKKKNKKRSMVGIGNNNKKGLGFLGTIGVGAAGIGAALAIAKALDYAFNNFRTGMKSTGRAFTGGV